jgi:hypothetical protein
MRIGAGNKTEQADMRMKRPISLPFSSDRVKIKEKNPTEEENDCLRHVCFAGMAEKELETDEKELVLRGGVGTGAPVCHRRG